jgi:cytochrome bd ubiquinol oxidase subunit I
VSNVIELSRWQFAITTVYHFLFVPVSIGMAGIVAGFQTAWYKTRNPQWMRLTRFFGKIMLLSFAVGVVTGIVQEFQFGMNWAGYSRYVGSVFGAPLAVEALGAFFIESTFLGIWIFGYKRISEGWHLATIWLAAFGSALSAYFILAANSWMQHPVGYKVVNGRAEMTSFWKLLTNSTVFFAFPHTVLGAFATAGFIILGISAWYLIRHRETEMFKRSAKAAIGVAAIATFATLIVGHFNGQLMTRQQPMKMASAEALYNTAAPAGFSLFAVAPFEQHPSRTTFDITVPHTLSLLATNTWSGQVKGINQLQAADVAKYGPGNYEPIIGVTYWTFRLMVGAGTLMFLMMLWGLWAWWRGTLERSKWFLKLAVPAIALPFIANATGWLFTEIGRQPWVVYGLMLTKNGISPSITAFDVWVSIILFTVIYGVLGGVAVWLTVRIIKKGPEPEIDEAGAPVEPNLHVAY